MRIHGFVFVLTLLATGCFMKKKTDTPVDPLAADRSVAIEFHPFWGGMSSCELERKGGKDKLTYTYIIRKAMGDSSYSAAGTITKAQADSVFVQAEKAEWDSDLFYGTADGPIGLTVFGEYKKGMLKKNLSCERLKDANELPKEFLKLAALLNAIAPEEMKLY